MTRVLAVFALLPSLLLGACGLFGGRYAAEVGYYKDGKEAWEIWGNFSTFEECQSAAIARYNDLNRDRPDRAFSWACLEKNSDGTYASRRR